MNKITTINNNCKIENFEYDNLVTSKQKSYIIYFNLFNNYQIFNNVKKIVLSDYDDYLITYEGFCETKIDFFKGYDGNINFNKIIKNQKGLSIIKKNNDNTYEYYINENNLNNPKIIYYHNINDNLDKFVINYNKKIYKKILINQENYSEIIENNINIDRGDTISPLYNHFLLNSKTYE